MLCKIKLDSFELNLFPSNWECKYFINPIQRAFNYINILLCAVCDIDTSSHYCVLSLAGSSPGPQSEFLTV